MWLRGYGSLLRSKRRRNQSKKWVGRRGRLDGSQVNVDRAVSGACEGYGLAGSANCFIERANQLSDIASEGAPQGPCIATRADHDGQQAAPSFGLSQPS